MELLYGIDHINLDSEFQRGEKSMMNIVKHKIAKGKKSGYQVNCKSPLAFKDCSKPSKDEINNPLFVVYMGLSD